MARETRAAVACHSVYRIALGAAHKRKTNARHGIAARGALRAHRRRHIILAKKYMALRAKKRRAVSHRP